MLSHTKQEKMEKPERVSFYKRLWRAQWPSSVRFNLAFAAIVGFLYALWVMGPRPLDPRNISWLSPDPSTYQIAWELYRQDPKIHWPITFTDHIGYPEGESMSMLDPNPLLAVLLKPFSRFLPEPFQYLGLEVAIILILQFFFALMLFRFLFGPDPLKVLLPSLFFLTAPILAFGIGHGHFANTNHWILIAALLLFSMAQKKEWGSLRRFTGYAVLLVAVAVAINAYVAVGALFVLAAAVVSMLWQKRVTVLRAAVIVAALGASFLASAYFFGYIIPGGKVTAGGYRAYSLNLLALIDPQNFGSILLPTMPRLDPQYIEGYSYLGLGVLLLLLFLLPVLIWRRKRLQLDHRIVLPFAACCLLLTLLALSTKITFGSRTLVDLDPHEKLTPYLSSFRISSRFFWTTYYAIMSATLAATIAVFRRRAAVALLSAAFVLQMVDTAGLWRWAHHENNQLHPLPLHSPVWSKLGAVYENLMIMPPWQCNPSATPGGLDGYRIFGLLAASQHMRINSYFAGRYTEVNRQAQCGPDIEALSHKPLSPDSAYVVTYMLAQQIAQGPTGPGKCHNVDQFILCSPKTDFGLSPLVDPGELLQNPLADADFEEPTLSAWPTFQNVTAVVSSARAHSGTHSLAETAGAGSVYQDLFGLTPGQIYQVVAWVAGTPGTTATAQISIYDPGANVATFSIPLTPKENWQMISHSARVSSQGILRVHLFRNPGSGTIFWDDVRVYRER
jgi:hypothetical protein